MDRSDPLQQPLSGDAASQLQPTFPVALRRQLPRVHVQANNTDLGGQVTESPTVIGMGSCGPVYKGAYKNVRHPSQLDYLKSTN